MTNNLFNLTNEMRIVALVLAKWNYDEMNENRISNSIFKHNFIDLAVSLKGVSN